MEGATKFSALKREVTAQRSNEESSFYGTQLKG